jgi:hypothetical protein
VWNYCYKIQTQPLCCVCEGTKSMSCKKPWSIILLEKLADAWIAMKFLAMVPTISKLYHSTVSHGISAIRFNISPTYDLVSHNKTPLSEAETFHVVFINTAVQFHWIYLTQYRVGDLRPPTRDALPSRLRSMLMRVGRLPRVTDSGTRQHGTLQSAFNRPGNGYIQTAVLL